METKVTPPQPGPVTPPSQPPAVPWTPREVWFGLALLVLWLVLALACALVVGLLELGWDTGLLVTLLEGLLLVPVWWLTVRKHKVGLGALGLRRFPFVMLVLAFGLMLVAYTFNFLHALVLLLLGVRPSMDLVSLVSQLEHPWLFFLGGVVVAPLAEEVFFRGFVFAGLRGRYGWVKAALISSALFSLMHLQLTQFLPLFLIGFFLALLYEKSRSLWPAVAMHAAINAIGLAAAYWYTRLGGV